MGTLLLVLGIFLGFIGLYVGLAIGALRLLVWILED